jgi:hypothetical protein
MSADGQTLGKALKYANELIDAQMDRNKAIDKSAQAFNLSPLDHQWLVENSWVPPKDRKK